MPTDYKATLNSKALVEMYSQMCHIRAFELRSVELFRQGGLIRGTIHPSIGQEAVAVGVCAALRPDDYITSTHRGHHHFIAKTVDRSKYLKRMMAELFGKETGYCKGRGGSMHICDFASGELGANGIVGAGMPIAGGAALAVKLRGTDQVVVTFFGDGAANEGIFHETANLASLWKLPLIMVCENNCWALGTPLELSTCVQNISARAAGYNMPGSTIDGNDVLLVYETTSAAVARARKGDGPSLIECKVVRWHAHSVISRGVYKTREEAMAWMTVDPIPRFKLVLAERGVLTEAEAGEIKEKARLAVEDAVKFAMESRSPDPGTVTDYLYT